MASDDLTRPPIGRFTAPPGPWSPGLPGFLTLRRWHPPPPAPSISSDDLHTFLHHWQDEADAAYLYRLLSDAEPDARKKDLFRRLAEVEDRHVEIWAKLLADHGRPVRSFRPSPRTRLLASLGRLLG